MAIAFDAFSQLDVGVGATTHTLSHTVTGTNTYLLVHVQTAASGGADIVSGVTYNSVAMTRLDSINVESGGNQRIYFYYLTGTATGANNIVVTTSTNDTPSIRGSSFTGVAQASPHDVSGSAQATAGANLVLTVSVTATDCWLITGSRSRATAFTNGTGTTIRTTVALNDVTADSNGTVSTGSVSLTLVTGGSTLSGGIVAAIKPFVAVVQKFSPSGGVAIGGVPLY